MIMRAAVASLLLLVFAVHGAFGTELQTTSDPKTVVHSLMTATKDGDEAGIIAAFDKSDVRLEKAISAYAKKIVAIRALLKTVSDKFSGLPAGASTELQPFSDATIKDLIAALDTATVDASDPDAIVVTLPIEPRVRLRIIKASGKIDIRPILRIDASASDAAIDAVVNNELKYAQIAQDIRKEADENKFASIDALIQEYHTRLLRLVLAELASSRPAASPKNLAPPVAYDVNDVRDWSGSGTRVVGSWADGNVGVWDFVTGQRLAGVQIDVAAGGSLHHPLVSNGTSPMLFCETTGSGKDSASVFDLSNGHLICDAGKIFHGLLLVGGRPMEHILGFSRDDQFLYLTTYNGALTEVDPKTGKVQAMLPPPGGIQLPRPMETIVSANGTGFIIMDRDILRGYNTEGKMTWENKPRKSDDTEGGHVRFVDQPCIGNKAVYFDIADNKLESVSFGDGSIKEVPFDGKIESLLCVSNSDLRLALRVDDGIEIQAADQKTVRLSGVPHIFECRFSDDGQHLLVLPSWENNLKEMETTGVINAHRSSNVLKIYSAISGDLEREIPLTKAGEK